MITREEKNKSMVNKIKKEETINLSRKILKIFLSVFLLCALLFAYMYFIGVRGLFTNEYVLQDNIPKSFNGVKVLHFTDLLYGSSIDLDYLDKLENEIKKINPNIVVFTGNIITNDYKPSEEEINKLKEFFKNLPYSIGKYAVRGNVDKTNFDLIMDNTDFTILDNEEINVFNNTKESINIIGINNQEIKQIKQNNDNYTITLINNYDNYSKYNLTSNLILAGNNLGGEIKLGSIPLLGDNIYDKSYYKEGNSTIYISNGIGSIHHMRFMNHPSINVYRLITK